MYIEYRIVPATRRKTWPFNSSRQILIFNAYLDNRLWIKCKRDFHYFKMFFPVSMSYGLAFIFTCNAFLSLSRVSQRSFFAKFLFVLMLTYLFPEFRTKRFLFRIRRTPYFAYHEYKKTGLYIYKLVICLFYVFKPCWPMFFILTKIHPILGSGMLKRDYSASSSSSLMRIFLSVPIRAI